MIPFLQELDITLLSWIHHAWRSVPTDRFFLWITEVRHFAIPLAVAWLVLMVFGRAPARWLALLLLLCLLLTDQIASQVIKPWVGRVRPCFAVDGITALLPQADSPSFPSSHAANMFGAAGVFLFERGRRWWWTLVVALIVSLSRVYIGVHYPSDVLGGALLGLLLAAIACWIVGLLRASWQLRRGTRRRR